MRRILAILVLVLSAVVIGWWVPYSKWANITDALLVFLGLLVAALVQVIPVTANFLQSDSLTVDEAKQLTMALERQQQYWLGLLGAAVVAAIILVVGKAIPENFWSISLHIGDKVYVGDLQKLFSGVVGSLLVLVVVKMFGVFPGVLSLQRLRGDLVVKAAKRRLAERVLAETAARKPLPEVVPDDYGKAISPPH